MFQRGKAKPSLRAKLGLAAAFVFVMGAIVVPQIGTASATEGNMSTACAGVDGVAEGKLKAFETFRAYVNGKEIPTGIRKIDQHVKQGDTVRIDFKLKPECAGTYVGISSFEATTPYDDTVAEYRAQKLHQRDGGVYDANAQYSISVAVPPCYFQLDVNTGGVYVPGDFTLDRAGRLLLAAQGGSDAECKKPTPTLPPTTAATVPPTTAPPVTAPPTTAPPVTAPPTTAPPVTILETHNPSAKFDKVCSVDGSGFTGKLTNQGNVTESFQIYVNGQLADTVTVPANSTVPKTWTFSTLDIASGATASVNVKVNNQTIATTTVANDCFGGTATAASACDTAAGSGAVITMTNSGALTENFTVYRDGREVTGSPVAVAPGETRQKLLALEEDETAVIRVVGQNTGVDITENTPVNCEEPAPVAPPTTQAPEVLAETVTQPQLAATGADLRPWAIGGLLSIALGMALIRRAYTIRAYR